MDVLAKIRRMLEERGWTEYYLAKQAHIPQSTVTNMFARNNTPTIATLENLCLAFGISLSQFFSEGEEAITLTAEQKELLEKYTLLTKSQKEKVLLFLDGMLTN